MIRRLTIVHSGNPPQLSEGVVCPACSDYFGFRFRPLVTIEPKRAFRRADGSIDIRDPVVVCAQCQTRGVRTTL